MYVLLLVMSARIIYINRTGFDFKWFTYKYDNLQVGVVRL